MSSEIEMDDLRARKAAQDADTQATDTPKYKGGRLNQDADQEQAVTLWTYVSSALLLALAVPMILFPEVLLYISETGLERRNALTPLEAFLALHSGILLVAYALALLFNLPTSVLVDSVPSEKGISHPLLVPLTSACGVIALLSYNTTSVGSLAFLVFLGSVTLAVWGTWTILFSGTSYISRKTGADKRTSAFLFGNKAAASTQKKEWKKQQASAAL